MEYSPRIDVGLAPDATAGQATVAVLQSLLHTLRATAPGAALGEDPIFLHDFRVAVRRTRSALGQIKGVFTTGSIERFRPDFGWLGESTGPARDLDVLLLKLPGYCDGVAEPHRSRLAPVVSYFESCKRRQQQRVAEALGSDRYRALVGDWTDFLEDPPLGGKRAAQSARRVASRAIRRARKRVVRQGGRITVETRPKDLHRLRISGKKLRYLLEFFRRLFPEAEIAAVVSALKQLQDRLGDLNDYRVHRRLLQELADATSEVGLTEASRTAIDALLAELARAEGVERESLMGELSEFLGADTTALFELLFARQPEA